MPDRRSLLKAGAVLPWAGFARLAQADEPALIASPIAGHFTAERVRIWLQGDKPAKGSIAYSPAEGKAEKRTAEFALDAACSHSTIVELASLTPGTRYEYRVFLNGKDASPALYFRTARAASAAPGDFRVYLGSCAYSEALSPSGNPYGDGFQIFDSMAAQMQADALPHLMLWLGDNLYHRPAGKFKFIADFASAEGMDARYREVRAKPFLQKLFRATQHYAIWDDHDFGPNNSFKTFAFKNDSLLQFKRYWPNPDMGSAELPGTWCKFTQEDAEFILLDDRFYRDDEDAPASEDKAMFGPQQMAWLKKSLRDSKARFKIVAGGSQMLSENKNGVYSGWHGYRTERDVFFAWLKQEKIPGIIMLTGDRHNTSVMRLDIPGGAPVLEYCSSPLTSRLSRLSKTEWANPRLLKDFTAEQRNFGTLEFKGTGKERQVIGHCFDSDGKKLWSVPLAGQAI